MERGLGDLFTGLAEGFESGRKLAHDRKKLDLEKRLTDAKIKQMDAEDRLREMQLSKESHLASALLAGPSELPTGMQGPTRPGPIEEIPIAGQELVRGIARTGAGTPALQVYLEHLKEQNARRLAETKGEFRPLHFTGPIETPEGQRVLGMHPQTGQVVSQADLPAKPVKEPTRAPTSVEELIQLHSGGKYKTVMEAMGGGPEGAALVGKAIHQAKEVEPGTRPYEYAKARGLDIPMQMPVSPKERSDLFDRREFLATGRLKPLPPGITKGAAAARDVVEISDKQREELRGLDTSIGTIKELFARADKLITATGPMEAIVQKGELELGAITKQNPDAATYKAASEAFSSTTARSVGLERGVLTNQDVLRWQRVLPTFGDTVAVKESKKAIFAKILKLTREAMRRVIAGEDPQSARQQIKGDLDKAFGEADALLKK